MARAAPFFMNKQLIAYDDFSKISTWFEYDHDKDETYISYTGGETDKHVEASKSLQNDEDYTKQGLKNEMLHYAHIPPSILTQWAIMGVDINNRRALIEMVNKPEYAYLKTTTIKHLVKA